MSEEYWGPVEAYGNGRRVRRRLADGLIAEWVAAAPFATQLRMGRSQEDLQPIVTKGWESIQNVADRLYPVHHSAIAAAEKPEAQKVKFPYAAKFAIRTPNAGENCIVLRHWCETARVLRRHLGTCGWEETDVHIAWIVPTDGWRE